MTRFISEGLTHKAKIDYVKSFIVDDLESIFETFSSMYQETMRITEEDYPRVYNLRGIIMNLQSILKEVKQGIDSEYVDLGYFSEKLESLERDIKGFTNSFVTMQDGKYRRSN